MGDLPETERFSNCINIPNRQTEKLNEQTERNRVLEEENEKLKEIIKQKDQENSEISEVQVTNETLLASLDEWMKVQMEEVCKSTDKLKETTIEVYNRILKKGAAKAKATTSAERKELSEEIQKMENLCEDISKDIIKSNEEAVQKMTHFRVDSEPRCLSESEKLRKSLPEKAEDQKSDSEREHQKVFNERWTEENQQIKRFLGKWVCKDISKWSLEFGLDVTTGLYYCHHYYHDVKTPQFFRDRDDLWLPDGVWRNGIGATLQGNLLMTTDIRPQNPTKYCYELCEEGLKYKGIFYLREK